MVHHLSGSSPWIMLRDRPDAARSRQSIKPQDQYAFNIRSSRVHPLEALRSAHPQTHQGPSVRWSTPRKACHQDNPMHKYSAFNRQITTPPFTVITTEKMKQPKQKQLQPIPWGLCTQIPFKAGEIGMGRASHHTRHIPCQGYINPDKCQAKRKCAQSFSCREHQAF